MRQKDAQAFGVKGINTTDRTVSHVISARIVDRDGEVVEPTGCRYDSYIKNSGVVFFNHDARGLPIAKCLDITVTPTEVSAVTKFAGEEELHPQAETIFRLFAKGFLKSWSIGFKTVAASPKPVLKGQTGRTILEWDLLEYSAVGIPSNEAAVTRMLQRKAFTIPDGATKRDLMEALELSPLQQWWWMTRDIVNVSTGKAFDTLDETTGGALMPGPGRPTAEQMPQRKYIVRRGDQWCVVDESRTRTLGCHGTRQEALAQLRAVEANKDALECPGCGAEVPDGVPLCLKCGVGMVATIDGAPEAGSAGKEPTMPKVARAQPWTLSLDEVRELCAPCADKMAALGWKSLTITAMKQMPPQMLHGLCNSLGSGEGFFTRCSEHDFGSYEPGDKNAFCAWLHKQCEGKWPSERAMQETLFERKDWLREDEVKELEAILDGKALWTTEYINTLPDSSFAYVEGGGSKDEDGKTTPRNLRHLPYKDAEGKVDLPHLRNALARLALTDIPDAAKAKARKKLEAAAEAHNVGDRGNGGKAVTPEADGDEPGESAMDAVTEDQIECKRCGTANPPDAARCIKCGAVLREKAGRVISSANMARLKAAHTMLNDGRRHVKSLLGEYDTWRATPQKDGQPSWPDAATLTRHYDRLSQAHAMLRGGQAKLREVLKTAAIPVAETKPGVPEQPAPSGDPMLFGRLFDGTEDKDALMRELRAALGSAPAAN